MGAVDPVNCMPNYGYSLLEVECLRGINSSGLDAHVGFLHEMQPGKYSLALRPAGAVPVLGGPRGDHAHRE